MPTTPPLNKRQVFILQETDEMRHPYETAVAPLGAEIVWFTSWSSFLFSSAGQDPAAVVVDLDCLPTPLEPELVVARTQFTLSDMIALSGNDSSQLVLQCLRSGFSDFLLKPVSPEELSYSLRKSFQRREFIQRLDDPRSSLVRAVTQISGCTTPTLARICTLESLMLLVKAEGAAWITIDPRGKEYSRVVSSVPKTAESVKILSHFPFSSTGSDSKRLVVTRGKNDSRKMIYHSQNFPNQMVYAWGLEKKVTRQLASHSHLLLEHGEMTLLSLQKFDDIKQQTFIDDLTGLYNSRYLKFALANSILRCKEPNNKFSVLFIDVDHFKSVNDRYSHLVGSEFLVTIGKTVKNALRRIDPVFRYGGDEFVVILNGSGVDAAMEIAERIRKNIERRIFVIMGNRIQTTVSIGIATFPDHASDRDTLLRMADEAMYCVKKASRNAVHLATAANYSQNAKTGS